MENGIVRRWGEGGGKGVMRGFEWGEGWIEKMDVLEVCWGRWSGGMVKGVVDGEGREMGS